MNNVMEYKGYYGSVEYPPQITSYLEKLLALK